MEDPISLDKKFQKELNAGITALMLLSVLQQAQEPMYGYQIAKQLDADGENLPPIKQGVLYPVLRSLEKSELVASHVEPSVSGPPRRYYHITDPGRDTLVRWSQLWRQTVLFVQNVLEGDYHEQSN